MPVSDHFMAFLRNDAVNRVIVHTGVKALAESAGGIFFFVYLLKAGLSVEAALLAQAAIFTLRFVLRPAMLPLAVRFGVKPLLMAGTLLMALQYPLLTFVHGVRLALAVVCAAAGLGELVYYLAGNAYWAMVGDVEHRGQQIAARESLVAVVGIVGPLAGGAALTRFGPGPVFAVVGLTWRWRRKRPAPSAPPGPDSSWSPRTAGSTSATSTSGRSPFSSPWRRTSRATAGRWRWRAWRRRSPGSSSAATSTPAAVAGR
jgi:MFS family permease